MYSNDLYHVHDSFIVLFPYNYLLLIITFFCTYAHFSETFGFTYLTYLLGVLFSLYNLRGVELLLCILGIFYSFSMSF